ncbi:casein kinase I, partial [Lobulomyces angularis]
MSRNSPQQHQSSRQSKSSLNFPNVVGIHYRVLKKIGEGSFGVIYEGSNLVTQSPCAIKFESRKCDAPQLSNEYRTYKLLSGIPGVPAVHYFGQDGLHNILCIDLLGQNVETMFDLCGRKFSVKTVAMVAKRMLSLVQSVHEKNLIYRDIKPDNFLIGRTPRNNDLQYNIVLSIQDFIANHSANTPHPTSQIFIVDFGMAKTYRDPHTKIHIPYKEKKSLSGTARYMSINTHLGREQSRRDDLESLGHVFLYFLRGSLPWQGLKAATNKQKYEKIGEKKQSTTIKELCDGFPEEFGHYLSYARNLKFDEEPDYEYLKRLFDRVLHKIGDTDDGVFDWMIEMQRQLKERAKRRLDRELQYTSRTPTSENSAMKSERAVHQLDTNQLKATASNQTLDTSVNIANFGSSLGLGKDVNKLTLSPTSSSRYLGNLRDKESTGEVDVKNDSICQTAQNSQVTLQNMNNLNNNSLRQHIKSERNTKINQQQNQVNNGKIKKKKS